MSNYQTLMATFFLMLDSELQEYIEMRKMKKKDRKVTIANNIGETTQELQKEREKFKMTLDKWTPSEG